MNYIYLIQEREFIKTQENIYKIGMTTKENHTRFKQYPKNSTLLLQIVCDNCKKMEKEITKLFEQKFMIRKDIGREYFQGDYKLMINYICNMIKNEQEYDETEKESIDEIKENNVETHLHIIRTCEEFLEYTDFRKIVITNKKGEGYYKKKITNQLWNKFYDKASINFDPNNMEDLLGYIEFEKKITKVIRQNLIVKIYIKILLKNVFQYILQDFIQNIHILIL